MLLSIISFVSEILELIFYSTPRRGALNTTVGYLLGENDQADTFKNPEMLKRFKDILNFPKDKQEHIIYAIDSMIKATKLDSL